MEKTMKVSQLIKLLQRLEYECGDISVLNADDYSPKAECKELDGIGKVIILQVRSPQQEAPGEKGKDNHAWN